jgi:hypothetical protein
MIGQRMSSPQANIDIRTVASNVCSYLEWDSTFFNKRIARANCARLDESKVSEILEWCRDHRIDCLYFLGDTDDAETSRVLSAKKLNCPRQLRPLECDWRANPTTLYCDSLREPFTLTHAFTLTSTSIATNVACCMLPGSRRVSTTQLKPFLFLK